MGSAPYQHLLWWAAAIGAVAAVLVVASYIGGRRSTESMSVRGDVYDGEVAFGGLGAYASGTFVVRQPPGQPAGRFPAPIDPPMPS